MADIRIEKKKPVWPWLILIIILAVLAFLYIYGDMGTEEADDLDNTDIEEVTYLLNEKGFDNNTTAII